MPENLINPIGVWVDHAKAHFINYKKGTATLIETLDSPYDRFKREPGEVNDSTWFTTNPEHASNNEFKKNNTAQNELNEYFKILESKLRPYNEILLFGPSTAKDQLFNRLVEVKSFKDKKIKVKKCDKMTDNQLLAFVREFYNNDA